MTANLRRKIGEILECRISGHPVSLRRVRGRYDYAKGDRARCPVCGGLGIPWGGMFHCEENDWKRTPDGLSHKAIIETGECFVRVR